MIFLIMITDFLGNGEVPYYAEETSKTVLRKFNKVTG